MASCSEMKAGEVYVCADCGLEIQVLKTGAALGEG
jgi:DNA-directed RNA polymerase subunit RPC12/RpoP